MDLKIVVEHLYIKFINTLSNSLPLKKITMNILLFYPYILSLTY